MRPLTAGVEIKIATELGRANGADRKELGQALVGLRASGEGVKDATGVGEFVVDILLRYLLCVGRGFLIPNFL